MSEDYYTNPALSTEIIFNKAFNKELEHEILIILEKYESIKFGKNFNKKFIL